MTEPNLPEPSSRSATSYDEVPYESFPLRQTHPDRLAALSVLLGLEAPQIAGSRVLELGCASGGNLLPIAVAYPKAQFVGVDLSAVQIAQGQADLDNVRAQIGRGKHREEILGHGELDLQQPA